MVDTHFDRHFARTKEKTMNTENQMQPEINENQAVATPKQNVNRRYESIDHYSRETGKRFRMTKDQKQRNLTRKQAFEEFNAN